LGEFGRSSASLVRQKLRSFLVVSEIALSLILLIGAGLLIKSTARLLSTNLGFNPENVVTMKMSVPVSRYKTEQELIVLTRQLTDRINSIPGVKDTAMINFLPFGGEVADLLQIEGKPSPQPGKEEVGNERVISNNYFQMMGVPLIKGRYFTDQDRKESGKVVIVNQALVNHVLPAEDAIGHRLLIEDSKYEIVGVVGDEKVGKLDAITPSVLYLPYQQSVSSDMCLVVRAVSDSSRKLNVEGIATAIQKEVHAIDRDIPIFSVMSMERLMTDTPEAFMRRFPAFLMGVFAAIALLLAMVGIYGVISYTVSQQTKEIGVRMALGAQRNDVFRHVAGSGMMLAALGVALGLVGAFMLTRVLSGFLFGVTATDPLIFAMVAVILSVVAFAACCIPARRAMRTDPMVALRYE